MGMKPISVGYNVIIAALAAIGLLITAACHADEMVHTPFGDKPATCVHHVPTRSRILDQVTVQYPDASRHTFAACANPHPSPATFGWVEEAYNSNAPYTGISGQWLVPAGPASSEGQTIYIFNGISTGPPPAGVILQPVLQWIFGPPWAIASWMCDSVCYASAPINVSPGDALTGTTLFDSTTGNWTITTQDDTTGQTTTLTATSSAAGGTSGTAVGGVLEVENVQTCSGYPATPITFINTTLTSNGNTLANVPFTPAIENNDGCGEGVNVNGISLAVTAAVAPINGACGPSNDTSQSSAPTSGLCTSGAASAVTGTGPWTWSCVGSNGGSTASCSAPVSLMGVNGACGPSNGTSQSSAPTSGLCTSGAASAVTGTGPWTWNCVGSNGGSTASCSAPVSLMGVNGVCGSANGSQPVRAPTSNLCASGKASTVSGSGYGFGGSLPPWKWSCLGSGGGSTAQCSAL